MGGGDDRVELQAEVDAPRARVYDLMATQDGLRRWLDDAEMEPVVGRPARFRLHDAVAFGKVLSVQPPQHISFSWDWEGASLGAPTVVAFDAIDHGQRSHVTLRHVGFRNEPQALEHEAIWLYWFERFKGAVTGAGRATPSAGLNS